LQLLARLKGTFRLLFLERDEGRASLPFSSRMPPCRLKSKNALSIGQFGGLSVSKKRSSKGIMPPLLRRSVSSHGLVSRFATADRQVERGHAVGVDALHAEPDPFGWVVDDTAPPGDLIPALARLLLALSNSNAKIEADELFVGHTEPLPMFGAAQQGQ
jgi:hypothetical protein